MFLLGGTVLGLTNITSALILTVTILLGVFMTFLVSKILSLTILKGVTSNFTIELPPYRKPQILKTIFRSIFDRTLFVLGRAIVVAIPAGILIWVFANINVNGISILQYIINFLQPLGSIMGLDGVILMAFILGLPANEIVMPIAIMGYLGTSTLTEITDLNILKDLLIQNGWSINTAICMILFCIFHWPCSTTILTIKKETGSAKWAALAFLIPTFVGILICTLVTFIFRLI